MNLLSIIGTRPQWIKCAALNREIQRRGHTHIVLNVGQHTSYTMSTVFESMLTGATIINHKATQENYELRMLDMIAFVNKFINNYIQKHLIDYTIVYGDCDATVAGALCSPRVAHIEGGIFSKEKTFESVNRLYVDMASDTVFCCTDEHKNNIDKITRRFRPRAHVVGDLLKDAYLQYKYSAMKPQVELPDKFIYMTLHRKENEEENKIINILIDYYKQYKLPIVIPVHPSKEKIMNDAIMGVDIYNKDMCEKIYDIEPVNYFESIWLLENCERVVTDSGGLQREAMFAGKPVDILWREWDDGYTGGDGKCAEKILDILENNER